MHTITHTHTHAHAHTITYLHMHTLDKITHTHDIPASFSFQHHFGPLINTLLLLLLQMKCTGIPELRSVEDLEYLRSVLVLDLTEEQAAEHFRQQIHKCLKLQWSTQLSWFAHNFVHRSSWHHNCPLYLEIVIVNHRIHPNVASLFEFLWLTVIIIKVLLQ